MASQIDVRLIDAGMQELLNDFGVRRELERRGRNVLAHAISEAPVGETGNFRDSLRLISTTTDRVSVRIGSDHPGALRIEAATGLLARSLDQARGA